ncbi:hypothetical protein LIER_02601 [Lithospermum erythrorhizon]|uniref:Uncharacterized protein n=1 Tax=Lithospermum erythrorhizon TaxID=34254 RepID=A0AAV3NQ17_LITER
MVGTRASFNLGQFIFDQIVHHAQSHAVLKPIAYPSMICSILEAQKSDILTTKDIEWPAPGFITISPKLMQETHVAHIPLRATGLARKSMLEERLRSLGGEDDPAVDPIASDSEAKASQE